MDPFSPQQPDEGYSEDPLNPTTASSSFAAKLQHDSPFLVSRSARHELPAWLLRHLSTMSLSSKIQLAVALLDELPTSVISQIVQQLNPRLYIDFVKYLPAEICLKILGYLDPVSLLSVARSCHAWYELALDRKLWESLYYLEGWKAITAEIQANEARTNAQLITSPGQVERLFSADGEHAYKKRAISTPPRLDRDRDHVMLDADRLAKDDSGEGGANTSLFGGPAAGFSRSSVMPGIGDLNVDSSGSSWGSRMDSKGKSGDKGGDRMLSSPSPDADLIKPQSLPEMFPTASPGALPKCTLWSWDPTSSRYRINWKYLYTMRRKLEANWDLGEFTNFQFPHPDHPEEGHGECIYSIQFNSEYLVSGSRDRTLRIWNMRTRRLVRRPLAGHRGSVLCLQFDSDPDEDLIVSGSSDSDVILWRFSTGQIIQRLGSAHHESVLNVKFDKRILVTCSKDKTIKIFNRRPLKPGDLGYGEVVVQPVPIHLKEYGYDGLDLLPLKPPYSLIASLEGHSAAVNAVQICDREVVSASGDRNVKIWDWPTQTCLRTFLGHNKGIACVQYDGRRIVSGSSDNEVKVFDRQSGVEVASLRSHSSLVRTVQAGFGDLPYSAIEDEKEAARIDQKYFEAVQNGTIPATTPPRRRHQAGNAGSTRPEDIMATGAKLPPGGGGGKYGRIVSGSYDATIVIWRRDKEGIWKARHTFRQEEAAAAAAAGHRLGGGFQRVSRRIHAADIAAATATPAPAAPPTSTATGMAAPPPSQTPAIPSTDTPHPFGHVQGDEFALANLSPSAQASLARLVDEFVDQGVHMLQQALASYPTMLAMQSHLQAAIDRQASPFVRSQLRQAVSTAMVRTRLAQARALRLAPSGGPPASNATHAAAAGTSNTPSLPNATSGSSDNSLPLVVDGSSQCLLQGQTQQPAAVAGAGASANSQDAMDATTTAHNDIASSQAQPQAQPQTTVPQPTAATVTGAPPPAVVPPPGPARQLAHHPHIPGGDGVNLARVFKLQFDARRLICCSQTSVIVGWDFCNGDKELEEASRFFGTVE